MENYILIIQSSRSKVFLHYIGKALKGFKCGSCDYTGQDGWTIQIHHVKCHSESFECGLCDFEAKTLDNLELHLTTCETYECEECEFVSTHISGIEKHFSENTNVPLAEFVLKWTETMQN